MVTKDMILEAKEARAMRQNDLRERYQCAVVSMTLNIPGDVKHHKNSCHVLLNTAQLLEKSFCDLNFVLVDEKLIYLQTGNEYLMGVKGDAFVIKRITVALENTLPYGRVLDIDVFSENGELLHRDSIGARSRPCFLCSKDAKLCIRQGHHETHALQGKAFELMEKI